MIIGIILVLIALSFSIIEFVQERGNKCTITVDEKEVYRYSLKDDRELSIHGPIGETHIKIENGSVWVTKAPCGQKICQKMGKINQNGEIIVCIPNKIIIRVESGNKDELDGITM